MSPAETPTSDQTRSPDDAANQLEALTRDLEECRAEAHYFALQIAGLTLHDAATGLLNLAGITEQIGSSADRLDRTGEPFGLIQIRIPELREHAEHNDWSTYAAAVRHVCKEVISGLRAVDHIGVADPGSFLISLPDLSPQGVDAVVSRVGRAIAAAALSLPGENRHGLHPEIGVVVSTTKPSVDVPKLLELSCTATRLARFGAPAVATAVADAAV